MKKRKNLSAKNFITFSVLLLIALVLALVFSATSLFFRNRQTDSLLDETESRTERIADNLSFYQMDLNTETTTISADIDETASFMKGRIMVISSGYRILKDTYVLKQNDYIVSRDVMQVMSGESREVRRIRGAFAEVILPVSAGGKIIGTIVSTASVSDVLAGCAELQQQMLILMAGIFLICCGVVPLISHISMQGVSKVNEELYHVAQGNLQDKIQEKGFRETRYLAQNYNKVLEKLSTVDQTRQEFVSNVSHELKTPITSMKVLAESLTENENATTADYREFMTDIVEEIDRETKIIDDLLTLVRTDSRRMQLDFEEASVNETLRGVVKTVEPLAKKRNIDLTFDTYKDVTAEIDRVKLSLAISNIVENAVKYNVDHGWIKVSLNADHRFFYIKVADSGVGIPEDAKDKIFERFYRVDKARSRDTGGTGLGLSITRSIINAHRGSINVYSEPGKGTTFSIRIPLKQGQTQEESQRQKQKEKKTGGSSRK